MTPIEHGFVGFYTTIALGLHRRFGWKAVASSAFIAMTPDWDWLACLWGDAAFCEIHRVWGHAIVSCLAVAIVYGLCDYRFDFPGRVARLVSKTAVPRNTWNRRDGLCWVAIMTTAIATHPIADLLVTGGNGIPPWPVGLLWPFSRVAFTCPVLNWGDPGILAIFGIALAIMTILRRPSRTTALGVFVALAVYAWFR